VVGLLQGGRDAVADRLVMPKFVPRGAAGPCVPRERRRALAA
jgi:hypothetical protein